MKEEYKREIDFEKWRKIIKKWKKNMAWVKDKK